jgi:nicotinate phosphoribosyltransferase
VPLTYPVDEANRHLVGIHAARNYFSHNLKSFRKDHLRPINPTPYKVSASREFYDFFQALWQATAAIKEL